MIDENRFWELLNIWEYQTGGVSSSTVILTHPALAEIIAMGPEIIPLLLKTLDRRWFLSYALHKLTDEWPVKKEYAGNSEKIIECWHKWGRQHGYKI